MHPTRRSKQAFMTPYIGSTMLRDAPPLRSVSPAPSVARLCPLALSKRRASRRGANEFLSQKKRMNDSCLDWVNGKEGGLDLCTLLAMVAVQLGSS